MKTSVSLPSNSLKSIETRFNGAIMRHKTTQWSYKENLRETNRKTLPTNSETSLLQTTIVWLSLRKKQRILLTKSTGPSHL